MRDRMIRSTFMGLLMSLVMSASSFANETATTDNKALNKTHAKVSKSYEGVSHINADTLASMDKESFLIFDVRERDEFDVSHIENSTWVKPSMEADEFYVVYGEQIKDKTLVLYCSVGVRSSRLAEKLMTSRPAANNSPIYNLEKGIFGWHNESRPLELNSDSTDFVHPYNRLWGRMVNRKDLRRYKSEEHK